MSSFRHAEPADRMAEFKAIVTASFDDIGSNVALERIPQDTLRPNRLVPQARVPPTPSSSSVTDKCTGTGTRRSPLSFLRKVKSHATSLLSSHAKPAPAPPLPPTSFIPSPPTRPRAPTPVPFASSLPRNFLTRASGKRHYTPDYPDSGPQNSFFDDDDDDIVDRPVRPPRRRISSALAHSNSRLSSAFAAAPVLFGLASQSVSTPYLIAEKNDVVKPESRPDVAHRQSSKPSLGLKLRTKLSLPKLTSHRSQPSSPSIEPSPVTPSYHSHPYSTVFTDLDNTQLCRALLEDRLTTPEEDPFRRDEMAHPFLANRRLNYSSPRSGSLDGDSDTDKEFTGPHSFQMLSSRWSSDSDSPPSSLNHTSANSGRPVPATCVSNAPSQGPSRSPLSLAFPLPPSPQKGAPIPGVTVRVTTPTPSPAPAYPPPLSPPPSTPLPRAPSVGASITSRSQLARPQKDAWGSRRVSEKSMAKSTPTRAGQTQRRRSHVQVDKSTAIPALRSLGERSDDAKPTQPKSARRRDRPVTPFPLLPVGRVRQDSTGRLEASDAVTGFTHPCEDSAFDQSVDALPDSEVEPDRDFDSDKARKKTSLSSTTSAQTTASNTSTTSVSTTRSLSSVLTALTAATTVSPSTSPNMSADKPRHVSQVLVTDEEGRIVSAATYGIPPTSPPSTNVDAPSSGIYVEQGGTRHDAPSDLFLVRGEHVIVGAPGWTEFLNYCDTCHDVSVCLSGSSYGNGVADVLVVEIHRAGKACGVELRIVARTPTPHTGADFPGHIPGSYPLSSDPPSLLPAIQCVSPIDIPQSARSQWKGSALGLDGVPPLQEADRFTTPSSSQSGLRPSGRPDCTNEDEDQLRTVLAFTTTLPTTLRDLAKRAG